MLAWMSRMNMIWHDLIAHQREAVAVARLPENLDDRISGANRARKRQALMAGERNKLQVAMPVMANEFMGHGVGENTKTLRPFEKSRRRFCHPRRKTNPGKARPVPERERMLEWYHPTARVRQEKKRKGCATRQGPFSVQTERFDSAAHTISAVTLIGHPLAGWRYWRAFSEGTNDIVIETGAVDTNAPGLVNWAGYYFLKGIQIESWQQYGVYFDDGEDTGPNRSSRVQNKLKCCRRKMDPPPISSGHFI